VPHHRRRLHAAAALLAAGALASDCGGDDDFANDPRPPAPVTVTASIGPEAVDISPRALGAGPVEIIVTNQTDAAQQITFAGHGDDPGSGLRQETPPINPDSTASLTVDVGEGEYRLAVASDGIRAARLVVGAERPSSQNDLLLP
jgi:hypothetical protein